MVKISGGDGLTDDERVKLIQTATGVSESRARGMLARSEGRAAGDVTFGGRPRDLRRAEPVFLIYIATATSETVQAVRSDDNWRFWRSWSPSSKPSTGPLVPLVPAH